MPIKTSEGLPYPLGATPDGNGINFALFSEHATGVELNLFDPDSGELIRRVRLSARTNHVWHIYLHDISAGIHYGYRVSGPYEPLRGHRFNPNKLLIDPYAKKISGPITWRNELFAYDVDSQQKDLRMDTVDNAAFVPKAIVVDFNAIEPVKPLAKAIPWRHTVIYETHVKGYTQLNMQLPIDQRGKYLGLAQSEVLENIKALGVTAIELLPVHGFIDEEFLTNQNLTNFWGYNSLHFFMPHRAYEIEDGIAEFRYMVNAIHDAGLEVILDVVYNHTCEGNHLGPTLSFRGIDNKSYYVLEAHDKRLYANDTGCGNTLNIKHPRVLQMVMDSLRFWVNDMGVDGFRFDLATVLGRKPKGFSQKSGFFSAIRQDPSLAHCKMIAEPWDIGPGGYQLGNYPSGWSEWNDRYRDTIRRFWRGDAGLLNEFVRRIHGSSDIFEHSGRAPSSSINFVTSHDGFTLHDLVTYNERHNLDNNEDNRDGHHTNYSHNYGHEGETDDSDIIAIRERQKRNLLATLILSQGTPMLLAGDEHGRTQKGNNNAYCQDNEINWINWHRLTETNKHLQTFTHHLIQLRRQLPLLTSRDYMHSPQQKLLRERKHVHWLDEHGHEMNSINWNDSERSHFMWVLERFSLDARPIPVRERLTEKHIILFNATDYDIEFTLPLSRNFSHWQGALDTNIADGKNTSIIDKENNRVQLTSKSLQLFTAVIPDNTLRQP